MYDLQDSALSARIDEWNRKESFMLETYEYHVIKRTRVSVQALGMIWSDRREVIRL